jgi:hypothetical protein
LIDAVASGRPEKKRRLSSSEVCNVDDSSTIMVGLRLIFFAGMMIIASSAFSVPHNPRTIATVRLESPSLFEAPNYYNAATTATPLGSQSKIKQWFALLGQCRRLLTRPALLRKISRVAVVVALCLAIQSGPAIAHAQAHPSSLSQTVETVIPTNQAHRPTTEQTLEIILETLDSVHDDVKSMRGEFDSLKADVKALDRKYTLAPLASALTASLMSLVLNQFKSKSSSN